MNRATECVLCLCLAAAASVGISGCESQSQSPRAASAGAPVAILPPPAGNPPALEQATGPAPVISERAAAVWAQLNSADITPESWEQAQAEQIGLGAESVPVLVQALESGDVMQRELAVSLLMQLGPDVPGVDEPLIRALDDASPFVRANAATALSTRPGHEERVIPVLTELLSCDDPQLRQMAATNLNNFGTEAAACVPQLSRALIDAPPEVLLPIVELLGRIGPPAEAARPQLQQIAFEQEGDAREAATAALQRITGE